jgi:glutamate--cysteine ligase
MLSSAGFEASIGSLQLAGVDRLEGLKGSLQLAETWMEGSNLIVDGNQPDLVLLNNDLTDSSALPDLGSLPVLPPPAMGWYRRRKSDHFRATQPYIDEVAAMLDIDPWLLGTHWFVSEQKCLVEESCLIELAAEVDECLSFLRTRYDELGIQGDPVLFVKNNRGTYGLGIIQIRSGTELLNLSRRKVNRLTYGKGGRNAEDYLLQEGVPTTLRWRDGVSEPCIYLAGGQAAGWFYRCHPKRGEMANLNAPSATFYSRQSLEQESDAVPMLRHADGWHALVAELAMLGMVDEADSLSSEVV